ncbi:MAG TPA: hypothetical protein VF918_23405 [Anaerolineales bacterium]
MNSPIILYTELLLGRSNPPLQEEIASFQDASQSLPLAHLPWYGLSRTVPGTTCGRASTRCGGEL